MALIVQRSRVRVRHDNPSIGQTALAAVISGRAAVAGAAPDFNRSLRRRLGRRRDQTTVALLPLALLAALALHAVGPAERARTAAPMVAAQASHVNLPAGTKVRLPDGLSAAGISMPGLPAGIGVNPADDQPPHVAAVLAADLWQAGNAVYQAKTSAAIAAAIDAIPSPPTASGPSLSDVLAAQVRLATAMLTVQALQQRATADQLAAAQQAVQQAEAQIETSKRILRSVTAVPSATPASAPTAMPASPVTVDTPEGRLARTAAQEAVVAAQAALVKTQHRSADVQIAQAQSELLTAQATLATAQQQAAAARSAQSAAAIAAAAAATPVLVPTVVPAIVTQPTVAAAPAANSPTTPQAGAQGGPAAAATNSTSRTVEITIPGTGDTTTAVLAIDPTIAPTPATAPPPQPVAQPTVAAPIAPPTPAVAGTVAAPTKNAVTVPAPSAAEIAVLQQRVALAQQKVTQYTAPADPAAVQQAQANLDAAQQRLNALLSPLPDQAAAISAPVDAATPTPASTPEAAGEDQAPTTASETASLADAQTRYNQATQWLQALSSGPDPAALNAAEDELHTAQGSFDELIARADASVKAQIDPNPQSALQKLAASPDILAQRPDVRAFIWPAHGAITSLFGPSHPLGIDIGQGLGLPVTAAASGVVSFSGGDPCCSYGYYLDITHPGGFTTRYGHLIAPSFLKPGTHVVQGQIIGLSGSTGFSTGPHLHFEIRLNGVPLDPLRLIAGATTGRQ